MLQMEDTDTNQTLSLLKVKEALEDAKINPSGFLKKNVREIPKVRAVLMTGGMVWYVPKNVFSAQFVQRKICANF